MFLKIYSGIAIAVLISGLNSCAFVRPEPSSFEKESTGVRDGEIVISPALNADVQGRALRGYDAVAYFESQDAVMGDAAWTVSWQGADWHFSSAENQAKFADNPERYAPENGGFCTFGIVLAKKFDIDPTVWIIREQGLYVFLNEEVKEKFLQDEPGNFQRVQANWPLIRDKSPEDL